MRPLLLLLAAAASAGCTWPATYGGVTKQLATDCEQNCAKMDLRLGAVVIIASSSGCVCEPRGDADSGTTRAGAAAAAGGAVIAAQATRQQSQGTKAPSTGPSVPSIR